MSLHDVITELLHAGFPKTEADRDRLLAAVAADAAAQAHRDGPKLVAEPAADSAPLEVAPRYDPNTGERL